MFLLLIIIEQNIILTKSSDNQKTLVLRISLPNYKSIRLFIQWTRLRAGMRSFVPYFRGFKGFFKQIKKIIFSTNKKNDFFKISQWSNLLKAKNNF